VIKIYTICLLLCCAIFSTAQEFTIGLRTNEALRNNGNVLPTKQTRSINLPFFDDFSNPGPAPDATKWADQQVYINNTFGIDMVSQGVATFDAINATGISYHPNGLPASYKADSLTSQQIVLSGLQAADSIYLSFFIQPQGNGFRPDQFDSLLLYFLDNTNTWSRIWAIGGTPLTPFRQVMIPIKDAKYMHANFQFRFVNFVSPNTNDDVWNLDYVRLAKNRNKTDTVVNDMAFTKAPSSILYPYYTMPYRHFKNYTTTEQAAEYSNTITNNYKIAHTLGVNVVVQETATNTNIKTDNTNITLQPGSIMNAIYNAYAVNYNPANAFADVVFQHKYFYNKLNTLEFTGNDTILHNQVFSNAFGYDDGSAEKAYFLLGLPNTAASTALKFRLNVADTLRGLAIRFANQVPSGANKPFSIIVYKSLGANTQSQQIIYQQNFCKVQYTNTLDAFTNYSFDTTLALPPGEYYIGTIQAPNVGADSIYFGLDANTEGNINNFFYNVDGNWTPSLLKASTMLRPIVGGTFVPTAVQQVSKKTQTILYPNPAFTYIQVQPTSAITTYSIIDATGKVLQKNQYTANKIDIQTLPAGQYYLQLYYTNQLLSTTPFTKQ
jgi:hypothetical protein